MKNSKDFTMNLRDFFMKKINYNSFKLSCKFAFRSFLSFGENQKEESKYQQMSGLVTRNISVFC